MVTLHNNPVLFLSVRLQFCFGLTKLISSVHSEQSNVPAVSTAGNVCLSMPHCCLQAQSFVVAVVVAVVVLLRGRSSAG